MARSSSSSASKPWPITPPSRTKAAGSGNSARPSSSAHSGGACRSLAKLSSQGLSGTKACTCKDLFNDRPNATNSRGRTWRSAMRALMRCTSPMPFKFSRRLRQGPWPCRPCKAAMASRRCRAWLRSRWGSSSHCLSVRLPMPVMQVSSKENNVGLSSPRRVCVNSRLRRVAAGNSIRRSSRSTCRLCTWLRLRPWVCSA